MTPYAIQKGHINVGHLECLDIARKILDQLPDPDETCTATQVSHRREIMADATEKIVEVRHWTCHGLARLVHQRLLDVGYRWYVADGYYGERTAQHCWLWLPSRPQDEIFGVILDVYPIAGASGPILLAQYRVDGTLYRPAPIEFHHRRQKFNQEARQAAALLAPAMPLASTLNPHNPHKGVKASKTPVKRQ